MGSFYGMGGAISAKYAETGQQRKVDKRDMRPHDVEVEQTWEAGHRSIWGITQSGDPKPGQNMELGGYGWTKG